MVALVGVIGGRWIDRAQRQHEFTALLNSALDAQATSANADGQLASTRQYAMPLLISSSSLTVRTGLEKLVDASAAKAAAQVRATRQSLANLTVLPWHTSLRKSKADNLAYLDTWTAYLDSVSRGGDFGALPTEDIAARLADAAAALRAAAPTQTDALKTDRLLNPAGSQ